MTGPTLLEHIRQELIDHDLVRAPDDPGVGARPWLPPCYRHPDQGPIAPGDAKDMKLSADAFDDGLVITLMWAPGIPSVPGAEERRIDGVDIFIRATSGPAAVLFEAALRAVLLGTEPGGRTNWTMNGLGVIQSRIYAPFQPLNTFDDVFTFTIGYTFETYVA